MALIEFLSDGLVSAIHSFFNGVVRLSYFSFSFEDMRLNMTDSLILPKMSLSILEVSISMVRCIHFIDRPDVLCPNFMYDVRTIRFISFFLGLEEA